MEQKEQAQIVATALSLEKQIEQLSTSFQSVSAQSFKSAPDQPAEVRFSPTYPEVKIDKKLGVPKAIIMFFGIGIVMGTVMSFLDLTGALQLLYGFVMVVAMWGTPIAYLIKRSNAIKREEDEIRNSDEYKAQCIKIDEETARKNKEANKKYLQEMKQYEETVLPQYEKELSLWTEKHNRQIEQIKTELQSTQENLDKTYDTNVIPKQYRSIEAWSYLDDIMSTSTFDIAQAIEDYNKHRSRIIDTARLQEQQYANALADEQNDLLDQQNRISEKIRRDQNIAAVVGTVQRHGINKKLKDLTDKK